MPRGYPIEEQFALTDGSPRAIAVAPAINISGQRGVDPLLQADIVFEKVQTIRGATAIPVNRVVETFAALDLTQVESHEQAMLVCEALGADALLVPTITAFDPYAPPKLGASLQLFVRRGVWARPRPVDMRELTRAATPGPMESLPRNADFMQAAGMFDAANGSVRQRLSQYASGRHDPDGAMGEREFLHSMDRYSGFVWQELLVELLNQR